MFSCAKYKQIEGIVNSLRIPMSFANQFQVSYLFQQRGNMGSWGKIQVLSIIMPIIVNELRKWNSYPKHRKYPEAYLKFFECLSHDINKLLQEEMTEDELIELESKLIPETISLHDGLFPPSNAKLCFHQMLCSLGHIRHMGGIRGWWAFGGERSLSTIKKFVPRGGNSMIKTVIERLNKFEKCRLDTGYDFKLNNSDIDVADSVRKGNLYQSLFNSGQFYVMDGNLHYTNKRMILQKPISNERIEFNIFEMDHLLLELLQEIIDQANSREDAFSKSPLFRTYYQFSRIRTELTFVEWLQGDLTKFCYDGEYKDRDPPFVKPLIYTSDLQKVRDLCSFSPQQIYSQAYIYGLKWHCRGVHCRETTVTDVTNQPTNSQNDLNIHWLENGRTQSSWFHAFRGRRPQLNNNTMYHLQNPRKTNFLGQFNFFFYLNMPSEPFVDGLPFASATKRTLKRASENIFVINAADSYFDGSIFQSLIHVTASKLMFYGVDDSVQQTMEMGKVKYLKKPYRNNLRNQNINPVIKERSFSDKNLENVFELIFLFLQPYRRNIKFDHRDVCNYKHLNL